MNSLVAWIPALIVLSGLTAGLVLWALARATSRYSVPVPDQTKRKDSLLLNKDMIVDSTFTLPPSHRGDAISTWEDLRNWLSPRFKELPLRLEKIDREHHQAFEAASPDDSAELEIRPTTVGFAIDLVDQEAFSPAITHELKKQVDGQRLYRFAVENAPLIVFEINSKNKLQWRNKAFAALPAELTDRLVRFSVAQAFSDEDAIGFETLFGDSEYHFSVSVTVHEEHKIFYAQNITRLVKADKARGSFVQTLTKTFADLATGLAVFDRKRRLALFNPALVDLTGLSAEFLSGRPELAEVFDRLRDKQVLPEPKNYKDWRDQIDQMISSAAEGFYSEAWSLPGGLTYRITGRPHPDGAVAFLIEDISDEISLSRHHRSQVELRQSLIDQMDAAIAVLGPDGLIIFCNEACQRLLGFNPDGRLGETSYETLFGYCEQALPDVAFWNDAIDLVRRQGGSDRSPTGLQSRTETAFCAIEPLPGGFLALRLELRSRLEAETA